MHRVDVPVIRIDFPLLQQTKDLSDFAVPGYELIARSGMLCEQLIEAVNRTTSEGDRQLSLDEAVVGGLLVRLTKLCRAIFDSTQSDQSEAHSPLARLAAETAITLRWFVEKAGPASYKRFRADSFAFFREMQARATEHAGTDEVADALGDMVRIEIDQRLEAAGLTWDDVPEQGQSWGPDVRQRFEALGQDSLYPTMFKSHSAYVHPTWHELAALHLKRRGDGYVLAYSCAEIIPVAAYVLAQLSTEAVLDAARVLPHDLDMESLGEVVERTVEATHHLSREFAEFGVRVGFEAEFMA